MDNFSEKYDRNKFINFLNDKTNFNTIGKNFKIGNKNLFKSIEQIGVIDLDEKIPVFEVEHNSKNDPRIELTKNFYSVLSSQSIKTSVVIFFCNDSNKYRLSLIESSLIWVNDSRVQREFSSPKRLSFLLGEGAKIHTPFNQFKNKIKNYQDLKSRFDKEVVTEEFFENYKRLFLDLSKYLEEDVKFLNFSNKINLSIYLFAKKLLGQIVFCYFLQKKNWLGAKKNTSIDNGDNNFLRNRFIDIHKNKKNYFNDFLEPLFYLGLNFDNNNSYCEQLDCKIPYLNGGLFEPLENYNWEEENLNIPNKIFSNTEKTGILDTFDLYNFTVDENEDLDVEISIDPEMLGHVYEKLLDIEKKEEEGTYYTPKELAIYMCRLSIVNFLKQNLQLEKELDFHRLFIKDADITNFKSHFKKIDSLLKNISICDPCIGSGAFPVTMMNEISQLRFRLLADNNINKDETIYNFKKHFIQNNIYGVDVEPGAVEIAKLRLWLSLVVDIKDIKNISALPNLDYKIMQGDSLIDEYHGIKFEENNTEDLFGVDDELKKIINELQKKQNEYFNLKYFKSKISKRKEVQELLKKILLIALEQQSSKLNFSKNKKDLELINAIKKNIHEISSTYAVKDFFFWKLFFSNIFNNNGGFDIVIANPPYVFTRDVDWEDQYKKFIIKKYLNFDESSSSNRVQTNKINLYIVFQILGLDLINKNGVSCFIVPNTTLRSVIHKNFRKYTLDKSNIIEIVDLKANAFVGVTTSPVIILKNKKIIKNNKIKIVDTNFSKLKAVSLDKVHYINQENLKLNPFYVFNIFSKNKDLEIISKIRNDKFLLKNLCKYIIEGIVVKNELIHNTRVNNKYRKFIRGGDIKKFKIEYNNEYLEYDRSRMHRARPDELWRANKKIFIQRISSGKNPLVSSIDENKLLGFASTNVLLIYDEYVQNHNYEIICSILNSKLINYFYSKSFSNGSELTVNISTSYLEEVPVPKLNTYTSKFFDEINKTYKKEIIENKNFETNSLDQLIYELYGINKEEQKFINEYFEN